MVRSTAAFCALINSAPNSDSDSEDITALMISVTLRIAPLFGGCLTFSERK
jgi:hypothetical protein